MEKILIVNNNLHIGGVQKALVNLLWSIRGQYDITLLLFAPVGGYMEEIPPEVKLITCSSHYRFLGMTGKDTRTPAEKLGRAFYAGVTRLFGRKYAVSLMAMGQKKLTGYDAAISYLHNGGDKVFYGGCNEFVLRHTDAPRKITFLHCDHRLCGGDTRANGEQYAKFDVIAACSRGCAESFLSVRPSLADRVRVVYNCHRTDELRRMAEADRVRMPEERVDIVTVARLGAEKAVPRAVEALGSLKGIVPFHYHIVGDGVQRPLVEESIHRFGLEEHVTLLGELQNPYGYIQAADLLLIPSVSEAAPMVIGEAVRLGTPVLSTRTSSVDEMILEPEVGWVCENSTQGLAQALEGLLKDPQWIGSKRDSMSSVPTDNETALQQFRALLTDRKL